MRRPWRLPGARSDAIENCMPSKAVRAAGRLPFSPPGQGRRGAPPSLHPSPRQGAKLAPWTPFYPCICSSEASLRRRRFRSPAGRRISGRRPGLFPPRSSTSRGPHDLSIRIAGCIRRIGLHAAVRAGWRDRPLGWARRHPRGLRADSLDGFVAARWFRRYAKRDRAGAKTAPPQALASRGLSRFVERGRA